MPKAYESMRDQFIADGMTPEKAKEKAARIYNSKHPNHPVTRSSDDHKKGKK